MPPDLAPLLALGGLGTFILIAATWLVGIALLADSLILTVFAALGFTVKRMVGVSGPAFSARSSIWSRTRS